MKKLPRGRWISFWRHFYDSEKTVEGLTASMIRWQEKWKWSFLKLNPPACYHVLDWGASYEFYKDGVTEPRLIHPVIEKKEDITRIVSLDVTKGAFGDQLCVIRNLRSHFGSGLPILQTVFSPIEVAHRLMNGRESFLKILREAPDAVHTLLAQISITLGRYVTECLGAGADGIFFATKWATSDFLVWDLYEDFGKRYEIPLLNTLKDRNALLILHVCGNRTHLNRMLDYPVDIFSYDFYAPGAPGPDELYEETGKYVLGGINPDQLETDPESVIRNSLTFAKIPGWLAGPSCVLPVQVPDSAIQRLKTELCSQLSFS